jgi:anti-anti-sigma factor
MTTMFAGAGQQGAFACATAARGTLPGSRRLTVLIETAGAIAHVSLRGTLDTSTAASAYDRIVGSAAAPARRVDVDLTGLEAATRAGCRAIFVAAGLLRGRGGRLTILGARADVERMLRNAGFDAVIEFRDGAAPSERATSPVSVPSGLRGAA